jgi:bifunctional DNA-binding transcriptional regulator/antitoxin component of YhaV-PrlF toxin-antitoxin module
MSKYQESRLVRELSKVYGKGKTQVPSEVRKSMGVRDGDRLLWIMFEGKWVVERA